MSSLLVFIRERPEIQSVMLVFSTGFVNYCPCNQRWALLIEFRYFDIPIANGLTKTYPECRTNIAIGLQISDWQHWTSNIPLAIGLTKIFRTKIGLFLLFLDFFHKIFGRSSKSHELIAVHIGFGISVAVGVPVDAIFVVGISTVASPTVVANFVVLRSCCCCWGPWWMLLACLLLMLLSLMLVVFILVLASLHAVAGYTTCTVRYFCMHPCLSILYCTVQWDYRTIGIWILDCYFFCKRTIGISNIGLANFWNYLTIGYRIKASSYRTIGYRIHKKLAVAHLCL